MLDLRRNDCLVLTKAYNERMVLPGMPVLRSFVKVGEWVCKWRGLGGVSGWVLRSNKLYFSITFFLG